jgi:hypothetical protein
MVMGEKKMFKTAIDLVSLIDFHQDVNVSRSDALNTRKLCALTN